MLRDGRTARRLAAAPLLVLASPPTVASRAAFSFGGARWRLVLASGGAVRHVFPIKSLGRGPAERDGQTVSQFATYVYEFGGGRTRFGHPSESN